MLHLLAEVVLRSLLHLREHHRRNLLRHELLRLALHLHRDHGLAAFVDEIEGQKLLVALYGLLVVLAADEALHVKERLRGVDRGLGLRGLADQTLLISESNVGRGDAVTLVVRNDLHATILVDSDARISRAKIDPDDGTVDLVLSSHKSGKEKSGAHGGLGCSE